MVALGDHSRGVDLKVAVPPGCKRNVLPVWRPGQKPISISIEIQKRLAGSIVAHDPQIVRPPNLRSPSEPNVLGGHSWRRGHTSRKGHHHNEGDPMGQPTRHRALLPCAEWTGTFYFYEPEGSTAV